MNQSEFEENTSDKSQARENAFVKNIVGFEVSKNKTKEKATYFRRSIEKCSKK